MGFGDWLKRDIEKSRDMKHYYKVGCEVLGAPAGGWWGSTLRERTDRIEAGKKEVERRRRLGAQATESALRSAYREAQAQRGRDVQFKSNGITVKVKNGYSRQYDQFTTDIILIDPGRPGEHLHYILDENGNEIYARWTQNH